MEHAPSDQRSKHIIKYVVKLKQPQPEIVLAEFHHSAHASGYKQHRPERAPLQRIRNDKSQRKEKQDIIQDLLPLPGTSA